MMRYPKPTRATVISAVLLITAFFFAVRYANPTAFSLALGLPLIALGILIRLITNSMLVKNRSTCRSGLYAVCRHPMYVGTLTLAAGIAVSLNHPLALALPAAAAAISIHRIRKEEAYLMASLADYVHYKRGVPAFPTPGSIIKAFAGGQFRQRLSLKQCFVNGEMLRANLYLALLVASGLYFQRIGKLYLPGAVLVAGAVISLLVTTALIRLHPGESRRSRADYLMPGVLGLGVLAVAALSISTS